MLEQRRGRAGLPTGQILALILLSIFAALSSMKVSAAGVIAKQKDRITIKYQTEEILVPIPAGYELTNFRRLQLDALPQLQKRQILAAFVPKITANNEYTVSPEAGKSRPSYYLVYRPRLDFSPDPKTDLLSVLAEQYYKTAFEEVSEEQRYALQRLDENTVSVTWVDASAYSLNSSEDQAPSASVNCINSTAYRKGQAILMFDTLEGCGLDVLAVRNHARDWLSRIKSANEPLSFGQQLLVEKAVSQPEVVENDAASKGDNEQGNTEENNHTSKVESEVAVGKPSIAGPHGFLYILAAALLLMLISASLQRKYKNTEHHE